MMLDILITFASMAGLAVTLELAAALARGRAHRRKLLSAATPCEQRALELPRIACDLHPIAVHERGGRFCLHCGRDYGVTVRPRGFDSLEQPAAEARGIVLDGAPITVVDGARVYSSNLRTYALHTDDPRWPRDTVQPWAGGAR